MTRQDIENALLAVANLPVDLGDGNMRMLEMRAAADGEPEFRVIQWRKGDEPSPWEPTSTPSR